MVHTSLQKNIGERYLGSWPELDFWRSIRSLVTHVGARPLREADERLRRAGEPGLD
jgi:hypothetical protein